jgi:hypothetical protein
MLTVLLRRFKLKRRYNGSVGGSSPGRVLLCDFDGAFQFAEELASVGFLVDQIRPDALRQVAVGDHDLFLFSLETPDGLNRALRTCEKLKAAQLTTPIALWSRKQIGPEFLNHQQSNLAADLYIHAPRSVSHLLDEICELLDCPLPPHLKSNSFFLEGDIDAEKIIQEYRSHIAQLEEEIGKLRAQTSGGEPLEEKEDLRPRLKALLEGQKLQFQTESEKIKIQLSEMEAQLLDREAKTHELESLVAQLYKKMDEISDSHEKAQSTLRAFYMQKLQMMESEKKELEQKMTSQPPRR